MKCRSFKYIFFVLNIFWSNQINAQNDSITIINTTLHDYIHLSKFLNDDTCFIIDVKRENDFSGFEIYTKNNNILKYKTSVFLLNDSLKCSRIIDIWEENDKLLFLCIGKSNTANYLVVCSISDDYKKIYVLDNTICQEIKTFSNPMISPTEIAGQKNWFLLENNPTDIEEYNIIKTQVVGNKLQVKRMALPKKDTYALFDVFWNDKNNELLFKIDDNIFEYDSELNLIKNEKYKVKIGEVQYYIGETIIINNTENNENKYLCIERLTKNDKFNLNKRVISLRPNFSHSEEDLLAEDIYFFRKYSKGNETYVFFSKSSLGSTNSNFGFEILKFTKDGLISSKLKVPFQRPIVLYNIDIDNKGNIIGSGEYTGSQEQFIFSIAPNSKYYIITKSIEIQKEKEIHFFPNPSKSYITIEFQNEFDQIVITSVDGKKINLIMNKSQIDISHLASGLYFCDILYRGKKVGFGKFLKVQ